MLFCVLPRNAIVYASDGNPIRFPKDFRFGASTSAYQIEGAWNEDGKGLSQWDYLVHTDPSYIADGTNGDVAADSYHLYHRDVEILKELNVDSFRFSISWSRILPNGVHAPRKKAPGTDFYECGRNILLAHAKAYHIYHDEGFGKSINGKVGVTMNLEWGIPSSNATDDVEAVKDYVAFLFDQYMHPIFSAQGNYPKNVLDRVAAVSLKQGLNSSRLRPFTEDEARYIKGTSDFLGINQYSTNVVYRNKSVVGMHPIPSVFDDAFFGTFKEPSWPTSQSPWLAEYAPGLYGVLMYIKDNYDNPIVYITENGFSTLTGLNDDDRVRYLRNYLSAVHQALADGVNVRGYFVWSLMDSFEWATGFSQRFGLYEVDIEDPDRPRTPRKSALVYSEIVRTRSIDFDFNPDPYIDVPCSGNRLVTVHFLVMVILYYLAC
ncbi:glycosyl hydrolase family 1 domain-containing protein [Phthorimaea operculella]|nr:glycosyl hydrolase family 1 domain-containing protein [Phthorimaea operculella]